MQCPNCGWEARGKFCTNCGRRMPLAPDAPLSQPTEEPTSQRDGGSMAADQLSGLEDRMAFEMAENAHEENAEAAPEHVTDTAELPLWGTTTTQQTGEPWYRALVARGPAYVPESRPMTLGEVVSGTLSILRRRLDQFLGVGIAFAAAMFVAGMVSFALAWSGLASGSRAAAALGILLGVLILVGVFVVAGALVAIAYMDIVGGRVESVEGVGLLYNTRGTLERAWSAFPQVFPALLLAVGVYLGVAIVFAALGYLFGPLRQLLQAIGQIVTIWLGINFLFVPQVALIDAAPPVDALRGSMRLVSGSFWRTSWYTLVGLALLLPIYVAGLIFIAILAAIFSFVPFLGTLLGAFVGAILFAVFYAFYITYTTLMYLDLKARKAGVGEVATRESSD